MNKKKKKKKKKKFRIKFRFVFLFLLFLILIGLGIKYALNIPITNIFISGNSYLIDQLGAKAPIPAYVVANPNAIYGGYGYYNGGCYGTFNNCCN